MEKVINWKRKWINNKLLIQNVGASYLIKGMSLVINILIIPAYLTYFSNNKVLGVWFVILSILSWILTFDLGIGNGLRNHLVIAFIDNNKDRVKQYISTAYISVGFLTVLLLFIGVIGIYIIDWNSLMNIDHSVIGRDLLTLSIIVSFIGVMLQFFLKLIFSILNALQLTAIPGLAMLATSVLVMFFVLNFNIANDDKKFLYLNIYYAMAINFPLLVTTVVVFSKKLSYAIPHFRLFRKCLLNNILKLGGMFFWVQIVFMLLVSTNEVLISSFYEPQDVVEYNIYFKLYYTLVTLFSLVSNPIWSAVTRAYNENNIDWIKNIYSILIRVFIITAVISLGSIIILQPVLNIWLGNKTIIVNYQTAILFALFSTTMVYVFVQTTIANGIGKLKPQAIGFSCAFIMKIILIYFASFFIESWSIVIAVNILVLFPFIVYQHYNLKKYLTYV